MNKYSNDTQLNEAAKTFGSKEKYMYYFRMYVFCSYSSKKELIFTTKKLYQVRVFTCAYTIFLKCTFIHVFRVA